MNSETTIKENCSNCEYNRQCFIKKQLGAVECQKDKDYITNLQQENKQLKESIDFLWNQFKKVNTINRKVKEYIKDLYDVRFTDKDKRKLLEILGDKE